MKKQYKGFKGSGYNNLKKSKKKDKELAKIANKMVTASLNQFGIQKTY